MPALLTHLTWDTPAGRLEAVEIGADAAAAHAAELARWYDEPYNRAMMSGSGDTTAADVVASIAARRAAGDRLFLLFADGQLVGDADFRHVAEREAEFAIMIGPRGTQGKGFGTRFSIMLHAFAFGTLGLEIAYLSIVPANVAGRRYEKVGYEEDLSCPASRYAEEIDDVTMSLPRARFEALHAASLAGIGMS